MSHFRVKLLVFVGALSFACDKDSSPPPAEAAKSSAKPDPSSEVGEPIAKPSKPIPIGVVCTKFDAKATFADGKLHIDLETDLPPDVELSLLVSRQYFEKRNATAYAIEYINQAGPIADWLGGKDLEISNDAAMQTFSAKQAERAAAGPIGEFDHFSSLIEVSLLVRLTDPVASGTCQVTERGNIEATWKFKYPMEVEGNQ